MTGDQQPPDTPVPGAGSDRALFDRHFASVLAEDSAQRQATAAGVASGSGGGFRVDPEAQRAAIGKLTQAVQELEALQFRWDSGVSAAAIGFDPVSVQLRKNMDEMARRAYLYVRTWTEQVRDTRDALKAQLAGYEAVEQRNVERMA